MRPKNGMMIRTDKIEGIIFDYGGTIDTNSIHWAEVLWQKYELHQIPVDKHSFREAFVYGERTLGKYPYIRPEYNFLDVLRIKLELQMKFLSGQGKLTKDKSVLNHYANLIADSAYQHVSDVLKITRPIIADLSKRYKLVLVSNFYGNIETILKDFNLFDYFSSIIESTVVGIRKPNPAIYQLGVDAIGFPASNVLVIGDSFTKDVIPAKSIGCQVVWLKGIGWNNDEKNDESIPDAIITDMAQLPFLLE